MVKVGVGAEVQERIGEELEIDGGWGQLCFERNILRPVGRTELVEQVEGRPRLVLAGRIVSCLPSHV